MSKYLNLDGLDRVAGYINEKLKTVTSMPISPNVNDIVLYKGTTTSNYKQGNIYLYTLIETYYQWTDLTTTYYTKSATPQSGDIVYSDTIGTDSGYTVTSYDSTNNQIQIINFTYNRNSSGDVSIYDWVSKGGISVVLNGDQAENEASFYAPLTSGTAGQVLVSNGTGSAPTWGDLTPGYTPSFVEDALVFGSGAIPEVSGTALVLNV